MITAMVDFLQNGLTVDLSRPPYELSEHLQSIGILTPANAITLDNARTLKVKLFPSDSTDEKIIGLINKDTDTLGKLNRLCNNVYCMDWRDETRFVEELDSGKYKSIDDALQSSDKLRERRRILNKKKEHER